MAEAIDGPALIREVEAFNRKFVVHPPGVPLVLSLWQIGTHCFELFDCYPYFVCLSPEKACGKTRTTEVSELLVDEPFRIVSATGAALFRTIHSKQPTLIVDEAEVLSSKSERAEDLRAILNAGHRPGVTVPRCVGQKNEVEQFGVYCPKLICAIRQLPETLRSRSIVNPIQRKRPSEHVARFRHRAAKEEAEPIRRRISLFIWQNWEAIKRGYAENGDLAFLSDRDAENFEALWAILTVADAPRLPELHAAAEWLAGAERESEEDENLSLLLLTHIRLVMAGLMAIPSAELVKSLKAIDDGPWMDDERFGQRKLARMLRQFGIRSKDIRVGNRVPKGYVRADFEPVFERYLPSGSFPSATELGNQQVAAKIQALREDFVADEKQPLTDSKQSDVALVADKDALERASEATQAVAQLGLPLPHTIPDDVSLTENLANCRCSSKVCACQLPGTRCACACSLNAQFCAVCLPMAEVEAVLDRLKGSGRRGRPEVN